MLDPAPRLAAPEAVPREDVVGLARRRPVPAPGRLVERPLLAPDRLVVLAEQAPGVAELEVVAAGEAGIAEPLDALPLLEEDLRGPLELPQEEERVVEGERDFGTPPLPRPIRQPLHVRERRLEGGDGLGVRVTPGGPGGDGGQVLDGLLGVVGPRVVMREAVHDLAEPARVEPLERARGRGVEGAALGLRHAPVDRLLGERVLEDVARLAGARPLVQELEPREVAEARLDAVGPVPEGVQQAQGDLPAEDRRRLQEAPGLGGQPVEAREQNLLDGVGHGERPAQLAVLAHRPRQLLEEEGVALGPRQDELGDRLGDGHRREHGAEDAQAVRGREGLERDLRGVGLLHAPRPMPRTAGQEQQDARARQSIDQRVQVGLRRPVDPVDVLDDEDQGLALALLECELPEQLLRPGVDGLRAQRLEPLRPGLDPEEPQEVRRGGLGHLLHDRLRTVRLVDAAERPHDSDEGQIRNRAAVREAVALEPRHGPVADSPPELEQEPRLADPGFSDDPDYLALPRHRRLQATQEQFQLVLPPDERRHGRPRFGRARLGSREDVGLRPGIVGGRRRREREVPAQERCRRGAGHDAVRLGALDERLEIPPRRAPGADVQLRGLAHVADEELADVDRLPHPDRRALLTPRPRDRVPDGDRGQRRAARRVADRVEPEDGQHPERAHPLDAAAEGARLLDHEVEGGAHGERRLRLGRREQTGAQEREATALPAARDGRRGRDVLDGRGRPQRARHRAPGLGGSRVLGPEPVLRDPGAEGVARDAERRRGPREVPAGSLQHLEQVVADRVVERPRHRRPLDRRRFGGRRRLELANALERAVISDALDISTARSRALASSRTLPGHRCSPRRVRASEERVLGGTA